MAEYVETWQDTMRRLEAHDEEFKLDPLLKINTLRLLITGKAKEYFELWEADHDPTDAKKTYEELLNKVFVLGSKTHVGHHSQGEDATRRRPHGCRSCRRLELGGLRPGGCL